jgi:membrane protein DedA with SNARE-associated domain
MFEALTQQIITMIQTLGPLGVLIGVLIESIIAPIPSPLIIMGAGFILIQTPLFTQAFVDIFFLIVLPGAFASTLGAFIGYGIGFYGGRVFVERYKRFLGVSWNDIEKIEKRFGKRKEKATIFFSRALPVVPLSLVSIACGALRIPKGTFTVWTFLGAIPRCFILGVLGWMLGQTYGQIAMMLDFFETVIFMLILLGVLAFVYLKVRKRIAPEV